MEDIRIIAIDFDGCLVEDKYPDIGDINAEVFEAAFTEQAAGSKLILWTCRAGRYLDAAVEFCASHELRFNAVNDHLPEMVAKYGGDAVKVYAAEYWDDRAVRMPRVKI